MKKFAIGLICLLATSCTPKVSYHNLQDDSVGFNEAVKRGFDKQLLMNIVRLRYRDTPTFLEVNTISSSYDFKRTLGSTFETGTDDVTSIGWRPSFSIEYNEKPTTIFAPLQGKTYVDRMLTPVPFDTILLLNSSGWNLGRLLRCCIQRMNNVKNAPSASGPTPPIPPVYEDFLEVADLFFQLDVSDAIHFLKKQDAESGATYYIVAIDPDAADQQVMNRLWSLLELDAGTYQIYLTRFTGKKHAGNEIAVETRSPLSVLYFLSHGVNVPVQDELCGRVTLTVGADGDVFEWNRVLGNLMTVNTAPDFNKKRCKSWPFISVCYRGQWFYIDDRDLSSKSTFSLLAQLMALQTGCPDMPVLTIPVASAP